MPLFDEKSAAIVEADKAFCAAIESACGELNMLLAGKDAGDAVELDRVRNAIRLARRVRAEMVKLIDEEWQR